MLFFPLFQICTSIIEASIAQVNIKQQLNVASKHISKQRTDSRLSDGVNM